jgi:hypothetical protein
MSAARVNVPPLRSEQIVGLESEGWLKLSSNASAQNDTHELITAFRQGVTNGDITQGRMFLRCG